jgi:uncharacterized protein YprB with RNaseH-like and TPR domain
MTKYFDIESRRTNDPAVIARLQASVQPPGNISKAETLAAWWKDKAPAAQLAAVEQTSLDGTYGRLASFAWAYDDSIVRCVYGDDELGMLHGAHDFFANNPSLLVAFNGEFDLRFLKQRMIINRIPVPTAINVALSKRDAYFDPMHEWAGFRGYVKQVELERVFGIEREDSITGADVGTAIDCGDWAAIERHNIADVTNLREIYKRITA